MRDGKHLMRSGDSACAHPAHRARRIQDIPVMFHALATSPEPAVKQSDSLRHYSKCPLLPSDSSFPENH